MDGENNPDDVTVEALNFLPPGAPPGDDFDENDEPLLFDGGSDDEVSEPVLKKRTDAMTSKVEVWIKLLEVLLVATDDEGSGLVLKDIETLLNELISDKLRASNKTLSSVWDSNFELCLKNGTLVHTAVSIHEIGLAAELEAETQGAARRKKVRTGSYVAKARLASTRQELEKVFAVVRSLPIEDVSPLLKTIFGHGAVQLSFGHASQSTRVQENRTREQFTHHLRNLLEQVHRCERAERQYAQHGRRAGTAQEGEGRPVGRTRTQELREEFAAKTTEEQDELRRCGAILTDEDVKQFQMMALLSEPKYAAAYRSVAVATRTARGWYPEMHAHIPPSEDNPVAVPPQTSRETSNQPMVTADEELDDQLDDIATHREDVSRVLRDVDPTNIPTAVREVTACQRNNGYLPEKRRRLSF